MNTPSAVIRPGDTLILAADRTWTEADFERIRTEVKERLDVEVCVISGVAGLAGLAVYRPTADGSQSADQPDVGDLDLLSRAELAEVGGAPPVVGEVLDEWNHRENGVTSSSHGVGSFLELLRDRGFHVAPLRQP